MMKVLVVTGGIGSGKSSVCRLLSVKYGIPVYEADRRAKELYSEIPSMLDQMETALGVSLRDDFGQFVPHRLSEVIFNDSEALGRIEDILFPEMKKDAMRSVPKKRLLCGQMKKDFATWAEGREVVAFESATILEKPQFEGFGDITLLVDAPLSLRLTRTMARDVVDETKVAMRMQAQPLMNSISEGRAFSRVDHIILNDSTFEKLEEKLDIFIEKSGLTKML